MKYLVTFDAAWADRHGVRWSTGKQQVNVDAESRTAAVLRVRGSWPPGAEGACRAEPAESPLLARVRFNHQNGLPSSRWVEDFPEELAGMDVTGAPI